MKAQLTLFALWALHSPPPLLSLFVCTISVVAVLVGGDRMYVLFLSHIYHASSFFTSITPHTPHLVYPAFYFIGMSSHCAEQNEYSKNKSPIDFILWHGHISHHLHCSRSPWLLGWWPVHLRWDWVWDCKPQLVLHLRECGGKQLRKPYIPLQDLFYCSRPPRSCYPP